MKKFKPYIIIISIILCLISFIGEKGQLVESLEIPVGIGCDIERKSTGIVYSIPLLVYSFQSNNKISSYVVTGKGVNMGESRENRQLKSGKKFILGLNKVFVFSEDSSRYGIRNLIDIVINNPDINDRAVNVICKGKAEDLLKFKIRGYSSSTEFIEGMIKNLKQYNFFPMQYTNIDLIVRMEAEGRNSLLPYLEIKEGTIQTTGLAIFKKDKMVAKADIEDAKVINILKESNVKGILTLQKEPKKYINCYATSKRKVQCIKEGEKYKFIINLDLQGKIASDSLNDNIYRDVRVLKDFEEAMKKYVEVKCNGAINKLKSEYKVDFLDLGRVAAAKYGRGTGVDWDEIVSDSEIKVNVKFFVDSIGRGDY